MDGSAGRVDPPAEAVAGSVELLLEMGRLGAAAGALCERSLPDGVSMAKFCILDYLAQRRADGKPPSGPAQISRALGVTKAAVSQTLSRLTQNGLVALSEDPSDGRGKLVELTGKGEDMRIACLVRLRKPSAEASDLLSPEEWESLGALLGKLKPGLEAKK